MAGERALCAPGKLLYRADTEGKVSLSGADPKPVTPTLEPDGDLGIYKLSPAGRPLTASQIAWNVILPGAAGTTDRCVPSAMANDDGEPRQYHGISGVHNRPTPAAPYPEAISGSPHRPGAKKDTYAVSIFDSFSRPSSTIAASRILNFMIFPETVIGKSSTNLT